MGGRPQTRTSGLLLRAARVPSLVPRLAILACPGNIVAPDRATRRSKSFRSRAFLLDRGCVSRSRSRSTTTTTTTTTTERR